MSVLNNNKILLGVCGGVAAYKSAALVRLLVKQGAHVQVVMTQSANEFVGASTFQALSGRVVRSTLFDLNAEAGMGHIDLARWADLIIVAPATANSIAKIAHGLADDLLTTLCLASKAPLILAPAMNQQMWQHPATQANIEILTLRNASICGPAEGEQACGDIGLGRMKEPEDLLEHCQRQLSLLHYKKQSIDVNSPAQNKRPLIDEQALINKQVIITAGPTIEDIDPVRYVSNRSSGKMGYAIAQAAADAGAHVVLISGPVALETPENVEVHKVRSAAQMYEKVFQKIAAADLFIATAAVADYRPRKKIESKIKKIKNNLTIEFVKNPDILAEVAALKNKPLTIGFAAETNDLEVYAIDKLERKKVDMIVANKVSDTEGFESDNNELILFWHEKKKNSVTSKKLHFASKKQLAMLLIEEISLLLTT